MSIPLDAFHPEVTEKGISFSADVNATRVYCILSKAALRLLQNDGDVGKSDDLVLLKKQWATIQTITHLKIQKNYYQPNGEVIICPSDFE
jgi:hypothetical protein